MEQEERKQASQQYMWEHRCPKAALNKLGNLIFALIAATCNPRVILLSSVETRSDCVLKIDIFQKFSSFYWHWKFQTM